MNHFKLFSIHLCLMWKEIEDSIKNQFGADFRIQQQFTLQGGDINDVYKLESNQGRYVIKVNNRTLFPGMFEKEKLGLELLVMNSNFRIPKVYLTGDTTTKSFLLMEHITEGNESQSYWEQFGITLAEMHKSSNDKFGLSENNYIGSREQSNLEHKNWHSFFRKERILFQAEEAIKKDLLDSNNLNDLELLLNKIKELVPQEKPALLHGDLWSGNKMADKHGVPVIYDPAVYYGHREMDIAMTRLFGGFPPLMYDAYHSSFPLQTGWQERVEIHNLYPLLVHVNLFGGSYVQQVKRIIKKYS